MKELVKCHITLEIKESYIDILKDVLRCLTVERYDHEFYNMFKNYTFLDGTPFGIKEE